MLRLRHLKHDMFFLWLSVNLMSLGIGLLVLALFALGGLLLYAVLAASGFHWSAILLGVFCVCGVLSILASILFESLHYRKQR